jgi:hypothetical protein
MPEIRLSFIKMGAAVHPEPGKLFLDTGNSLTHGILDHHHLSRETCAAILALERKELYTDWLAGYDAVDVVLHEQPDIDCIAALCIVDAVLNGKDIGEELLKKLARYTLDKDMGRTERPDIERPSLYDILMGRFQIIRNDFACGEDKSGEEPHFDFECRAMYERMTVEGLDIISRFLSMMERGEIRDFRMSGEETDESLFREERAYLADDSARYLADLSDFNRVTIIPARIPLKEINTSETKRALIYRDPASTLFKIWARHDTFHAGSEEGFATLLVIRNTGKGKRYIISTDPLGKYCLRFLGDVLNHHEKRKREILGIPQDGPNRPGYDIPDPWYDGRAHGYTIVDTPHDGTALDEEEIISLFTNFVTEHIFLKTRMRENRVMVIFPLRTPKRAEDLPRRISAAGFEPIPVDDAFRQTFSSSFITLFFSRKTSIKLYTRKDAEKRTIIFPVGRKEERISVTIEASYLLSYGAILLSAVQMRVEDERLEVIQELNRFLNSLYLTRALTPEDETRWGFLLDTARNLGIECELFMNRVFLFTSVLLANFHSFREPDLAAPIIQSFLSCEATSIPSRPHENELIRYTDYYSIGMNNNRYLSFQNLYDTRLNQKNTLNIFFSDQKHYSFLYLFVILKKVVLSDFSERFSRLDVMHITRRTAREYRALVSDVLNYVNTINTRRISNDRITMQVCDRLHEVNAISESFSEIFTSMEQLNDYHDARIQKRQSEQMDLLQGIFLVGVVASVVTLGAMPGARILTYDAAGKLLGKSELEAFSLSDLLRFAPIVVITAFAIFLLIKTVFLLLKKE